DPMAAFYSVWNRGVSKWRGRTPGGRADAAFSLPAGVRGCDFSPAGCWYCFSRGGKGGGGGWWGYVGKKRRGGAHRVVAGGGRGSMSRHRKPWCYRMIGRSYGGFPLLVGPVRRWLLQA